VVVDAEGIPWEWSGPRRTAMTRRFWPSTLEALEALALPPESVSAYTSTAATTRTSPASSLGEP